MSVVFACDLGGSGLRAALIDREGETIARHRVPIPLPEDEGCWREAEPETWWRALADAAEVLAQARPAEFARVAAVAIAAFTRTQVFVGTDGRSLRPAILWHDTRAGALASELAALIPPDHPEAATINAFHPAARLHWLRRQEPETFAALAKILEPKDFLNFRLTGCMAGDRVSQARLAAAATAGPGGRSILAAAGIPEAVLPELLEPLGFVGRVRAGLEGALSRLAGAAVVAMANDTWASVVGLGAMQPGFAYNLSGTTEVFGLVSGREAACEGLLTVAWGEGLVQLGGPSQSGGDAVLWLAELLGRAGPGQEGAAATFEALLDGPRAAEPLLFLPYLRGERVPYWDPALRGAFVGLGRQHGPADLAWAVLEGVAMLNRVVLERAEAAAGTAVSEIRFGGGGAASARWRQIKADVTGRPVAVVRGEEQGLAGAAIAAWTALGRFPDLHAAQEALVAVAGRSEPRPERRAFHDRLHALFRASETGLAPVSHGLSALRRPA